MPASEPRDPIGGRSEQIGKWQYPRLLCSLNSVSHLILDLKILDADDIITVISKTRGIILPCDQIRQATVCTNQIAVKLMAQIRREVEGIVQEPIHGGRQGCRLSAFRGDLYRGGRSSETFSGVGQAEIAGLEEPRQRV